MLFRTSESYMTWEEYALMIQRRERLLFIDRTARRSIDNYWKNKGVLN